MRFGLLTFGAVAVVAVALGALWWGVPFERPIADGALSGRWGLCVDGPAVRLRPCVRHLHLLRAIPGTDGETRVRVPRVVWVLNRTGATARMGDAWMSIESWSGHDRCVVMRAHPARRRRADEPNLRVCARARMSEWGRRIELHVDARAIDLPARWLVSVALAVGDADWSRVDAAGGISGELRATVSIHPVVRPIGGAAFGVRAERSELVPLGVSMVAHSGAAPRSAPSLVRRRVIDPAWRPAPPTAPRAPALLRALVRLREDPTPGSNACVDLPGLVHAAGRWGSAGRVGPGASTIPMQVVKLLWVGDDRTAGRKVDQIVLAVLLCESLLSNDWIDLYLTLAPFGAGESGAEAGAWHWFGRPLDALDPAELAVLSVVLPQPVVHAQQAAAQDTVAVGLWREARRSLRALRTVPYGVPSTGVAARWHAAHSRHLERALAAPPPAVDAGRLRPGSRALPSPGPISASPSLDTAWRSPSSTSTAP